MDRIEHFEDSLLQLKLHLENLQACDTFEHFKACQTAFVTALVADQEQQLLHAKAERIAKDAADVFLHDTEFVTKLKDAVGKVTETTVKTQWQVAATDDPRTDPVQNDRAARRTDLTPSQQAKLDLAKGQSDTIKGKIK